MIFWGFLSSLRRSIRSYSVLKAVEVAFLVSLSEIMAVKTAFDALAVFFCPL